MNACRCGCGALVAREFVRGHNHRSAFMPIEPRFWPLVDRSGTCWLWTGKRQRSGYGRFYARGQHVLAHRVSWEIAHGPIRAGLHVLHKCDVRLCVNPAHLFLGYQRENMRDAQVKGRHVHGERHPFARLTESQVLELRRAYGQRGAVSAVARRLGIPLGTAFNVAAGKTWRHLPLHGGCYGDV